MTFPPARVCEGVELRVFHAAGYNSLELGAERALDEAQEARFEFAKVRRLILIDWRHIDDEGRAEFVWHWERP